MDITKLRKVIRYLKAVDLLTTDKVINDELDELVSYLQQYLLDQIKSTTEKFECISDYDGNDSFEVEGNSAGEAAIEALGQLGWYLATSKDD